MSEVSICKCSHARNRHHGYQNEGACSDPDCDCLCFREHYLADDCGSRIPARKTLAGTAIFDMDVENPDEWT